MSTARRFIALTLLVTGAGTVAWPGNADNTSWLIDYDLAMAAAQCDGRPVMIVFTGSDWCSWCKQMDEEILSTPEFISFSDTNLILLNIDFPKSIELPEARMKKNRSLQKKYGISGYPAVVVTDSEGAVIGRLSYSSGGPEPFLGELSKIIE